MNSLPFVVRNNLVCLPLANSKVRIPISWRYFYTLVVSHSVDVRCARKVFLRRRKGKCSNTLSLRHSKKRNSLVIKGRSLDNNLLGAFYVRGMTPGFLRRNESVICLSIMSVLCTPVSIFASMFSSLETRCSQSRPVGWVSPAWQGHPARRRLRPPCGTNPSSF